MNKTYYILAVLLLLLAACSDNVQTEKTSAVRVEFTDCTSCLECVEDFSCPSNAIQIDPVSGKAFIDADRCTQCMDCIDEFDCDDDAFTTEVDEIAPAEITDFAAVSDSTGRLDITFTAVGDDGTWGQTHHYAMKLLDADNNQIDYAFTLPYPQQTGDQENWTIETLPENMLITVQLHVYDEIGNFPEMTTAEVEIMGIIEDNAAPAAIDDLQVQNPGTDSVILAFTAVGDDEMEGTASAYQIRYSLSNIDATNWDNAAEFNQTFIPAVAGETEQLQITGLETATEYFFGVKAIDDNQNFATISNIVYITTEAEADVTAPAQVTDLLAETESNFAELSWTSVGDDENTGTALYYEIRMASVTITAANWAEADLLSNLPEPAEAGNAENYTVTGLDANTTFYFAIKAFDESANVSQLSNCADVTTAVDEVVPATITDFAVDEGQASANDRIKVQWTAPGDNANEGTADSYEVRYSTNEITVANWSSANLVTSNVPAPAEAGVSQNFYVEDLNDATVYYFAIKTTDAAGNVSDISNCPAGKIVFQINEAQCRDCNSCINDCDYDAISDVGPYKTIDPDLCEACGDCSCPYGLIHLWVVGY